MPDPAAERGGQRSTPAAADALAVKTSTIEPLNSTPRPCGVSVNTNGTRKAGSVYFHVRIIVANGSAPVSAAAANGESAVGGLTSERTA